MGIRAALRQETTSLTLTLSQRERGTARGGLALVAAVMLVAMCGCKTQYYMSGFPVADSSSGGVTVKFSGKMIGVGYGVPQIPRPQTIYMCEPWLWTAVIAVKDARPQIPPITSGSEARIVFEAPIGFFGTNALAVGGNVQKTLRIWRGKDGFLHAIPGDDADLPAERPGREVREQGKVEQ